MLNERLSPEGKAEAGPAGSGVERPLERRIRRCGVGPVVAGCRFRVHLGLRSREGTSGVGAPVAAAGQKPVFRAAVR